MDGRSVRFSTRLPSWIVASNVVDSDVRETPGCDMTGSDKEIREAAKRFLDRHGADALTEANKMLQDAIRQSDTQAISYWRALIRALPRIQQP